MKAWQQDRAGALVDVTLANKYGWKLGDRITLQGTIFPANLDLTIRGIYHRDPPQNALYFNAKYLEESVPWFKGQAGWYSTQIGSAEDVGRVSKEIDDMFRNSPLQTKTESEKAFQLGLCGVAGQREGVHPGDLRRGSVHHHAGFGQHDGDVGAQSHPRSGCAQDSGVYAATGIVDFRERVGGIRRGRRDCWEFLFAIPVIWFLTRGFIALGVPLSMHVNVPTAALSMLAALTLGLVSGYLPAFNASRINIVDGLRHIG